MALFAPYRPAELTATVPCSAVRTTTDRGTGVTILVIGPNRDGRLMQTGAGGARVLVDDEVVAVVDRRATGWSADRTARGNPDGPAVLGLPAVGERPGLP
jgi:arabinosyltransferase B